MSVLEDGISAYGMETPSAVRPVLAWLGSGEIAFIGIASETDQNIKFWIIFLSEEDKIIFMLQFLTIPEIF